VKRAFEFGPKISRPRAQWQSPARQQPLDTILRHQNIGIGEDDPIVAGCVPAAHAIAQLLIRAHLFVADDHLRGPVRMARDQTLDEGQDRMACPRGVKNNLIGWIAGNSIPMFLRRKLSKPQGGGPRRPLGRRAAAEGARALAFRIAASPILIRLRKVKKKQNLVAAYAIAIVRLPGYYPIFARERNRPCGRV